MKISYAKAALSLLLALQSFESTSAANIRRRADAGKGKGTKMPKSEGCNEGKGHRALMSKSVPKEPEMEKTAPQTKQKSSEGPTKLKTIEPSTKSKTTKAPKGGKKGLCSEPPSQAPSELPSEVPSDQPSIDAQIPSSQPSLSATPSSLPSAEPSLSAMPSLTPSTNPSTSVAPSQVPSTQPSESAMPSSEPSTLPSSSLVPSQTPSTVPSESAMPSVAPSNEPSLSASPSQLPSSEPSTSSEPSSVPSSVPSLSAEPSQTPSLTPSMSSSPSSEPSIQPSLSSAPSNTMTRAFLNEVDYVENNFVEIAVVTGVLGQSGTTGLSIELYDSAGNATGNQTLLDDLLCNPSATSSLVLLCSATAAEDFFGIPFANLPDRGGVAIFTTIDQAVIQFASWGEPVTPLEGNTGTIANGITAIDYGEVLDPGVDSIGLAGEGCLFEDFLIDTTNTTFPENLQVGQQADRTVRLDNTGIPTGLPVDPVQPQNFSSCMDL
mmetsp:Transcript_8588/g.17838  ORF Transcript_8588/g.17838 Transcript_8588/m.17838 type:complete len:492 (-) Transcript_8588:2784-4259(-)